MSVADAKEASVDAAVSAVLSKLDGSFYIER